MPKFAFTIEEAAEASSMCRTKVYEAIGAGKLCARKNGKRTLILEADLRNWLDALPSLSPARAHNEAESRPAA